MKTLGRKLCFVGVLLFISFYFTGCMTSGGRFYSGDLRSNQEVAILVIHQDLDLRSFSGGGIDHDMTNLKIAELIPGSYNLCVSLNFNTAGSQVRSEGCGRITLNALAGHVYYVNYSSNLVKGVEGDFTYRIGMDDIADDTDYEKIKEGNKVKLKVNDYFKGQRPEIK
jgi:hypothetical protein